MCRMLAYLGEPATLASLALEPEHSLERQAWAPRMQSHGVVNADGFGVGWYDHAVRPEPALYRRSTPIWSDTSFHSLAGLVTTTGMLAAVRSATPGLAVEESGAPPFASGPWLFAHNGLIEGWRGDAGAEVLALVSRARAAELQSRVDSEALFALVLGGLDAGAGPLEALASAVTTVKEIAGGRFTCLMTDGHRIAGLRLGEPLFIRRGPAGIVVASEPSDGGADWEAVPDVSVLEADPAGARVMPL